MGMSLGVCYRLPQHPKVWATCHLRRAANPVPHLWGFPAQRATRPVLLGPVVRATYLIPSGMIQPVSTGFSETARSPSEEMKPMARSVYAEINLHITWHTKGNAAVLTDTVERQLH